jgi:tRNA A37 methylthiotransferase MiaB
MKTRTLKKDKVNVITLGCSKNLVDSEVLVSQLKNNNIDTEHQSAKRANIIIINTMQKQKKKARLTSYMLQDVYRNAIVAIWKMKYHR